MERVEDFEVEEKKIKEIEEERFEDRGGDVWDCITTHFEVGGLRNCDFKNWDWITTNFEFEKFMELIQKKSILFIME